MQLFVGLAVPSSLTKKNSRYKGIARLLFWYLDLHDFLSQNIIID